MIVPANSCFHYTSLYYNPPNILCQWIWKYIHKIEVDFGFSYSWSKSTPNWYWLNVFQLKFYLINHMPCWGCLGFKLGLGFVEFDPTKLQVYGQNKELAFFPFENMSSCGYLHSFFFGTESLVHLDYISWWKIWIWVSWSLNVLVRRTSPQ